MPNNEDNYNISTQVREKLAVRHNVQIDEISQCFSNRERRFLRDNRAEHRTDPPTQWFVAETNNGRKLKIMFIAEENRTITIKSAYEATDEVTSIYERHAVEI